MTQNQYSSLLATKWLFERLGNRQARRAQAPCMRIPRLSTSTTSIQGKTAKSQHGIHKVPRSLNPLSHNNTLNYNALILNVNLQQNSTFHALKILHFCTSATHPKL